VDGAVLVGDVDVDVRLEPHVAHLHLPLGDAEELDELLQLLGEQGDVPRRLEVGLGDDLQQRRAGPVQVDDAVVDAEPAGGLVQQLAGVLLQVRPADADRHRPPGVVGQLERPLAAQRLVVLADLVVLRQVG
jgi:hypothetical protein